MREKTDLKNQPTGEAIDLSANSSEALSEFLKEKVRYVYQSDEKNLELIEKFAGAIALTIVDTLFDLSKKLNIQLTAPFDINFRQLHSGIYALMDGETMTFNIDMIVTYCARMQNDYSRTIASIKALIAHEFYHYVTEKTYPEVAARAHQAVPTFNGDMHKYHLSRIEQSAELFSIKYLLELEDNNHIANIAEARQLKKELKYNLIKARLIRNLRNLFRGISKT